MSTSLLVREVLPEHLIARLWRSKTGQTLRTTSGQRVRVQYPGRPAPGHGPDFQDAVLLMGGTEVRGDVEVHRTPSGWRAHGHETDPAYDGVVLHVVSDVGRGDPAGLPTVVLQPNDPVVQQGSERGPLAAIAAMDEADLRAALRRAGAARFRERTRGAMAEIKRYGTEQALLLRVFDALGYSGNRAPFRELARVTGARVLQAVTMSMPPQERAAALGEVLLASAGLSAPTRLWHAYVGGGVMDPGAWRRAGVRPGNHPIRRIASAAALLGRYPSGLYAPLLDAAFRGPSALVEAIRIRRTDGSLGTQRAHEIVVNAVLPVLAAASRMGGDRRSARAAQACYESFPALGENTVTREARRLLGDRAALRLAAREQQGLLHLYRGAVRQAR